MGCRPHGIRWVLLVSAVAFSPLGKPKLQAGSGGADKGARTPASPCCSLRAEHPAPDPFWHVLPGLQKSHQLGGDCSIPKRQGCAGTWPALVCTFCPPQPTSRWEQPPATTPGFATSPSPLPCCPPRLLSQCPRQAVLPPGTPPSQSAGRGGVSTSISPRR